MDIVYIVRKVDSFSYSLDFIFSLRSVAKFAKKFKTIHIYTDQSFSSIIDINNKPIREVVLPEARDIQHREAAGLFFLENAIKDKKVSDEFLLMDEAMFFTEETNIEKVPYYKSVNIPEFVAFSRLKYRQDYRRKALNDTYKLLKENGHDYVCYDLNCPIRLTKEKVKKVYDMYYVELFERGLCINSLYGNINDMTNEPKKRANNFILRSIRDFISIFDRDTGYYKPYAYIERGTFGRTPMISTLMKFFPEAQKWELIKV